MSGLAHPCLVQFSEISRIESPDPVVFYVFKLKLFLILKIKYFLATSPPSHCLLLLILKLSDLAQLLAMVTHEAADQTLILSHLLYSGLK